MAKNKKPKTFDVILTFDSPDAAHGFFVHWLDCGGDGGGNLDWHTEKWGDNKTHRWMRIKGTGYAVENGIVMTPEVEEKIINRKMKILKLQNKMSTTLKSHISNVGFAFENLSDKELDKFLKLTTGQLDKILLPCRPSQPVSNRNGGKAHSADKDKTGTKRSVSR